MATVAELQTTMDAAVAAINAGDLDTAFTKALAGQAILAALPSGQIGGAETRWTPQTINEFIQNLRRARGRSAGVQRTKITRARVSAS